VLGVSAFTRLSQLTALRLVRVGFEDEEPWSMLCKLTSLQQLTFKVGASGDPSPLSALTGLTSLWVSSLRRLEPDAPAPFSFSSLQPLSTLRQLEVLHLECACDATSLQGLAGLSNLKQLGLSFIQRLKNLEGISRGVIKLSLTSLANLVSLAGVEGCTSLQELSLGYCFKLSSLQHLMGLTSMRQLKVQDAEMTSLEGLNSMSLESLRLTYCRSLNHLSGLEHFSALKNLELESCGVTSLKPLSQLGEELQTLRVLVCRRVQEEVLELPHVQPTAKVCVGLCGNVKKVVWAGGDDEVF
jgi:Leucine-rich repeat (LRR) protein